MKMNRTTSTTETKQHSTQLSRFTIIILFFSFEVIYSNFFLFYRFFLNFLCKPVFGELLLLYTIQNIYSTFQQKSQLDISCYFKTLSFAFYARLKCFKIKMTEIFADKYQKQNPILNLHIGKHSRFYPKNTKMKNHIEQNREIMFSKKKEENECYQQRTFSIETICN